MSKQLTFGSTHQNKSTKATKASKSRSTILVFCCFVQKEKAENEDGDLGHSIQRLMINSVRKKINAYRKYSQFVSGLSNFQNFRFFTFTLLLKS